MADTPGIELCVGLGNPGPRYDQTRHNAGFWFVDELAQRHGGVFRDEPRFAGSLCRVTVAGCALWLLKPTTFMNRSGRSVQAVCAYYKIAPQRILVAHDDIDLPPGTARFKRGGGHGGHNGLRDIVAHLGKDFWRLRLGVGHPGHSDQVIDYVLARPSAQEETLIRERIAEAAGLLPWLVEGEMERAMHRLHTRVDDEG